MMNIWVGPVTPGRASAAVGRFAARCSSAPADISGARCRQEEGALGLGIDEAAKGCGAHTCTDCCDARNPHQSAREDREHYRMEEHGAIEQTYREPDQACSDRAGDAPLLWPAEQDPEGNAQERERIQALVQVPGEAYASNANPIARTTQAAAAATASPVAVGGASPRRPSHRGAAPTARTAASSASHGQRAGAGNRRVVPLRCDR